MKHLGYRQFGEWTIKNNTTNVKMPIFYRIRMNTTFSVIDGQFTLAGTHSPQLDGKEDSSKKILVFVKANVLKAGK